MNRLTKDTVLSQLQEQKEKNKKKYQIVKLGLFGSITTDKINKESDIDIVVELEKPKMFHLIGIKQELEEIFSLPVDIVRLRKKMNRFLKNRIEREAIFV